MVRGTDPWRTVKEWVGDNANTRAPQKVKDRVADRTDKCCTICGIRVYRGGQIDHAIRIKDWLGTEEAPHGNRETNLQFLCKPCHGKKTSGEATAGAKVNRIKKRHGPYKPEKTYWSKQYALAKARGWNPWGKR
jgi:5-methylcytosine-specific restriction protein A